MSVELMAAVETVSSEAVETTSSTAETSNYDPDERVECSENNEELSSDRKEYNPDDRVEVDDNKDSNNSENKSDNETSETQENDCPSTYKERLDQTPRDDGERGEWTGKRGESKFIPNDKEISDILAQYGLDGIEYQDAIPDFSDCSECTVEIDNMTEKRRGEGGNFEQCDEKCAEQWNKESRDGKSDWTARDVQKWREKNGYSWHERNDMKTCDLIPTKVNDYFGHLGGVGECRRRDSQNYLGGEFDE